MVTTSPKCQSEAIISPPTQRRQRLTPEARRAQLLDIAIDVFAEMGIERAGHGDIAKRAGVSTATVFNYFPTRPDLVQAVLNDIRQVVDAMFADLTDLSDDPQRRVMQMALAFQNMIVEKPSRAKTFLKWGVSFDPGIRPLYLSYQSELLDRLVEFFPDGPDPRTKARVLLGAADMLTIMAFDGTSPDQLMAYTQLVAKMLASPDV